MKKQIGLMMFILLLVGCETGSSLPLSNSSSASNGDAISTNDNKPSTNNSESITTKPSTSSKASTSSSGFSSSKPSTSNSGSLNTGDSIYPIPDNINNKFTIGDMNNRTKLSTMDQDSVSPLLNMIYGRNIVKASSIKYYSSTEGGGINMHTNKNATTYYGLQTHMFEDNWLKLELDIHIGTMKNNSKKDDKDKPIFTINAYNDQGKLLRTYYKENFDTGMMNHDIRIYLDGTNVSYLEILNTNLPYKSSQCYNFAVLGITLTGFPYAYED